MNKLNNDLKLFLCNYYQRFWQKSIELQDSLNLHTCFDNWIAGKTLCKEVNSKLMQELKKLRSNKSLIDLNYWHRLKCINDDDKHEKMFMDLGNLVLSLGVQSSNCDSMFSGFLSFKNRMNARLKDDYMVGRFKSSRYFSHYRKIEQEKEGSFKRRKKEKLPVCSEYEFNEKELDELCSKDDIEWLNMTSEFPQEVSAISKKLESIQFFSSTESDSDIPVIKIEEEEKAKRNKRKPALLTTTPVRRKKKSKKTTFKQPLIIQSGEVAYSPMIRTRSKKFQKSHVKLMQDESEIDNLEEVEMEDEFLPNLDDEDDEELSYFESVEETKEQIESRLKEEEELNLKDSKCLGNF